MTREDEPTADRLCRFTSPSSPVAVCQTANGTHTHTHTRNITQSGAMISVWEGFEPVTYNTCQYDAIQAFTVLSMIQASGSENWSQHITCNLFFNNQQAATPLGGLIVCKLMRKWPYSGYRCVMCNGSTAINQIVTTESTLFPSYFCAVAIVSK